MTNAALRFDHRTLRAFADQPWAEKLRRLNINPSVECDVEVQHDFWCPALAGGFCSCDPDVIVTNLRPVADALRLQG